jgi:predicted TIM-barrel fold metal-dependent hydrolase
VARFPDRLRGFCGFNPLRAYALEELTRCAEETSLRFGLKLHFGNSDVNLDDPAQVERLSRVFRSANDYGMAVVVHLRPSVTMRRPYGTTQARIFLREILSAAPDVPVQIAHLAGAGGYDDPGTDEALAVFVEAILRNDPSMANVYFDVSGVAGIGEWTEAKAEKVANRIRELGLRRVFYGSDAAVAANSPEEAWEKFKSIPLSQSEFDAIQRNIAPYAR